MAKRRTVKDTPSTPHFDFIFGAYTLSAWTVPYFSTTMSLRDAAQSLRLATDFPGAERIQWRLDELYQRDINWPRVERKIIPYLKDSENPQFFNALTIALLPLRPNTDLRRQFSAYDDWSPPDLENPERFDKQVKIGPISFGYWEEWGALGDLEARTGQLRWNPDEVFAVALDGQHRLAAIQQVVQTEAPGSAGLVSSHVPIILLILDDKLGYRAPGSRALVDVLRMLFIDLNKHARTVSRARQILLDDKDPHSVCVRRLIGECLTHGNEDLSKTPPRLPLGLIDWHTEQAKFDDGPYVGTVLGLDGLVAEALGAKPITDYTAYGAIRKQIRAIRTSTGLDLSEARKRLDRIAELALQPFSYLDVPENNELEKIGTAFSEVWNGPITTILTTFRPYANVVRARAQQGADTVDFANWYQLYYPMQKDKYGGRATQDYKKLIGRLEQRPEDPLPESRLVRALENIESLKRGNLAFNVVFQRALFLAFLEFQKIRHAHVDELVEEDDEDEELPDIEDDYEEEDYEEEEEEEVDDEDDGGDSPSSRLERRAVLVDERATQFVTAMNDAVDSAPELLEVEGTFEVEDEDRDNRFWLGTLLKPDGGIDFTQGASRRAKEVIFWIASMHLYDSITEPEIRSDFSRFWGDVLEREGALAKRIGRSIDRFVDRRRRGGGFRILSARDEEYSKEEALEEARLRMEWIWDKLEL